MDRERKAFLGSSVSKLQTSKKLIHTTAGNVMDQVANQ